MMMKLNNNQNKHKNKWKCKKMMKKIKKMIILWHNLVKPQPKEVLMLRKQKINYNHRNNKTIMMMTKILGKVNSQTWHKTLKV